MQDYQVSTNKEDIISILHGHMQYPLQSWRFLSPYQTHLYGYASPIMVLVTHGQLPGKCCIKKLSNLHCWEPIYMSLWLIRGIFLSNHYQVILPISDTLSSPSISNIIIPIYCFSCSNTYFVFSLPFHVRSALTIVWRLHSCQT